MDRSDDSCPSRRTLLRCRKASHKRHMITGEMSTSSSGSSKRASVSSGPTSGHLQLILIVSGGLRSWTDEDAWASGRMGPLLASTVFCSSAASPGIWSCGGGAAAAAGRARLRCVWTAVVSPDLGDTEAALDRLNVRDARRRAGRSPDRGQRGRSTLKLGGTRWLIGRTSWSSGATTSGDEPELLQRRGDGLPHAQHRPDRRRGGPVHRLLRGAELHCRAGGVHHRAEPVPHRADQGGDAGRRHRAAGGGPHDRHGAEGARLRDRPVRQEPPR